MTIEHRLIQDCVLEAPTLARRRRLARLALPWTPLRWRVVGQSLRVHTRLQCATQMGPAQSERSVHSAAGVINVMRWMSVELGAKMAPGHGGKLGLSQLFGERNEEFPARGFPDFQMGKLGISYPSNNLDNLEIYNGNQNMVRFLFIPKSCG
jgi:hypothetical protein